MLSRAVATGSTSPAAQARGLLIAALALVAAVAPLRAAEPLDLAQLDAITAGKVTATALAEAAARGPRAWTFTSTDVAVRRSRIASAVLRRVNGRLVVARMGEDRDIEVGFARAEARASGVAPTVACSADLRFSARPDVRLVESRRNIQSHAASCLCATFGFAVQRN